MKKLELLLVVLLGFSWEISCQSNWFDSELSNCIVALEKEIEGRKVHHGIF